MYAAASTPPPPHEAIWTLTNAVVASKALHVIAELGVADHIAEKPTDVQTLALACEADADGLDRVLRLLASHGIFARTADGYRHTAQSMLLRTDHPMSMRPFARMMGLPVVAATFDHLEHSVRTGATAIERVQPNGLWSYLAEDGHAQEVFGQAMTAKAAADIGVVLGAYDFGRFGTIADIGGGRGSLLRAVLDANPSAEGILFDLPDVVAAVQEDGDRMTTRAGDFFVDPLPSADLYLLMEVVHDWPDAEVNAILAAVRRAASPGARLLIVENVLVDDPDDARGHTLDVIMLAVTGGRERTLTELDRLLGDAGFGAGSLLDTPGPLRLVEAIAG